MKVITQEIGGVTVLIETVEAVPELVGAESGGRATQLTGIDEHIEATYSKIKTLIRALVEDIGTELYEMDAAKSPSEIQMDFSLGVSAQAGPIWVLSGKGEYLMKVKLTWKLGEVMHNSENKGS